MKWTTNIIIILLLSIASIGTAQEAAKDSLLAICTSTSVPDTSKVEAAIQLIIYHGATDDDIRYFMNSIGDNPSRRPKDRLKLLNVAMARYGRIGSVNQAEKTYKQLLQLAVQEESVEYQIKGNLTMARIERDRGDNTKAEVHLTNIEQLLKQEDLPAMQNAYYLERCTYARDKGKYTDALRYNDLAIAAADRPASRRLLANTYSQRGRIYRQLGETDSAEVYYQKSKSYAIEYQVLTQLPVILNNLGNIGHIKGKYDEAIGYYMESIALKEKSNDIRGLCIGYHNIGAIKNDMKAYEEARAQFLKSDEYASKIDFKKLHAYNALKTGWSYQMEERHEEALPYHMKALAISEDINFQKGQIDALIGIGVDQTNAGNLEIANTSLLEALAMAEASGNKSGECSALVGLADWYLQLDDSDYSRAAKMSDRDIENLLIRALALSKEMDYGEKKLLVYDGLQKLYNKTGANDKKAALLTEYMELKDSLYTEKRSDAIAAWETRYATAEKEKEIIQLEADNKIAQLRARTLQWSLGAITLFLGLLGFFGYKYQKRKSAQKRMEEAELFRTKLSSDLHDDVGTMLSSLAMQSEVMSLTAEAAQVEKFDKLSSLSREAMSRMRDTVWAIDSRKDSTKDLVDRMKDYLTDLLNGHKLKVDFQQDIADHMHKLRPDVRQNMYLIFKEAVNNAAKYSNGDQLTIRLSHSSSHLSLSIRDNGTVGNVKTSGTGMSNMKMRAERIGGAFSLKINDGFAIQVDVPQ